MIHASLKLNSERVALYAHKDTYLEDRKPRRAFGFVFDRHTKEKAERLLAKYGDNWLSRLIEQDSKKRGFPVFYLTVFFWTWCKTFHL